MNVFVDNNAKLLDLLSEVKTLPASSVQSKAGKTLFSLMEQAGLIQKLRKGAGNQYQIVSESELKKFIRSRYPSGLYRHKLENMPHRVQGILASQNSKSLKKLDFDLVTFRGQSSLFHHTRSYQLANLTSKQSYLTLKLDTKTCPDIQPEKSTIITVENPTAFVELESMVKIPWDMALYTGGKISNILLKQLKQWETQGHSILHFGDYDYVGLLEFTRILKLCPQAQLYYPPKLTETFLQQYGNTELLEKQTEQHKSLQTSIQKLGNSTGKSQLMDIYKLLQKNAKGLEQESLYLGVRV